MTDSVLSAAKPQPLYARVKQYLRDHIAAGKWPDGSKIPSEYALMDTLGASRMTVHRALRELSAEGILHRVQGVGSFVRKPTSRSGLLEIFDISEDILRRGHAHQSRILCLEARRADAETAAKFTLRAGSKIFYSEVVHTEDDIPVQLEERFVSPHFAPLYLDQDFTQQTTNRYLQSIAAASEVEHVVHAITADARMQNLVGNPTAEPCLLVERRTWTTCGPATASRLIHPGSRYSLGSRYQPKQPLF